MPSKNPKPDYSKPPTPNVPDAWKGVKRGTTVTGMDWCAHKYVRDRLAKGRELLLPEKQPETGNGKSARVLLDWLVVVCNYEVPRIAHELAVGTLVIEAVRNGADLAPQFYKRLYQMFLRSQREYVENL